MFVAGVVALLALAAAARLESAAFGLPTLLALWVLVQGTVLARKRRWVAACAIASSLLLSLQVALLGIFVWWNRGFGNTQAATQSLVLILWVFVVGVFCIAWFWRAKRSLAA